MKRTLLPAALAVGLLLAGPVVPGALAGKGRSYSSGRGGFSSGRNFSSGSRGSSFSRPAGGKSYSSGSVRPSVPKVSPPVRTSPSSPSPARPPVSATARSGKTYSSGAGPRPAAPPRPAPVRPPAGPTSTSGKSAIPGTPADSWNGKTAAPPALPRPRGGGFDSAAAEAQRKAESRARYTKGKAPEPTYRDPKGADHPIDPKDRRIEELRRELDRERWANRAYREREYYGPYYARPVIVYHDPYSTWFWWWLLDQGLQTRAYWAYNHRAVMDEARYRDLLARDARLEAEVRKLEAQKAPPDPAYVPPGIDPDLMYTDQYVTTAYNPQPPAPRHPGASLRAGLGVLVRALAVIAVVAFLVWLVFFKRWGGTEGGGPPGAAATPAAPRKGS